MSKLWFVFCGIVVSFAVVSEARNSPRIQVGEPLKTELNRILKSAVDFQKASTGVEPDKQKPSLAALVSDIDRAIAKSSRNRSENQIALLKILEAASAQFKIAQLSGDRGPLREGMSQVVQLHRVYELDQYHVFFCSQDRSVWLQSNTKAENPINPDKYKNCGKTVR